MLSEMLMVVSSGGANGPSRQETVVYDTTSAGITPPSWVEKATFKVWGGGGQGGSGSWADDTGGGGGTGGSYTEKTAAWTPADVIDVTVGLGGSGGVGLGSPGGSSYVEVVSSGDRLQAGGGSGAEDGSFGGNSFPGNSLDFMADGVFSGASTGTGVQGDDGEVLLLSSAGGDGGAGAGSGGAGGAGGPMTGLLDGDGTAGSAPGGGGGGGGQRSSGFNIDGAGADGADGRVIVIWKTADIA